MLDSEKYEDCEMEKSLPCIEKLENGDASVASGMAEYRPETDCSVAEVFARADKAMYACKKQMKQVK